MGTRTNNLINKGKAAFARGQIADACRSLRRAVKSSPHEVEPKYLLANCLVHAGKLDESVELFDQLLLRHKDVAAIHFSKGNALCLSKNFSDAVACYQRGLKLERNVAAMRSLGRAYLELENLKSAESSYRSILESDPADAEALDRAVELCQRRGAHGAAEQLLLNAIETAADGASVHFKLGNLFCDQGKHDEALTEYREAVALAPESPSVLYNIGHVLSLLDRWEEAAQSFQRAADVSPESLKTLVGLGIAYTRVGNTDAAADAFRRAIEAHPKAWEPAVCLGDLFAESKDSDELTSAAAAYEHLASIRRNTESLIRLGATYARMGRMAEATSALEEAVQIDPDNSLIRRIVGMVYWKNEDLESAEKCFREILRINPLDHFGFKYLTYIYLQRNDMQAAEKTLTEWTSRLPTDPIGQHLKRSLENQSLERASDAYIRAEFDEFAGSFDEVLRALDYCGPELIGNAVARMLPKQSAERVILDAGCGTGLCAHYLTRHARRLIGVDLSGKMLDAARKLDVYDELIEQELTAFLVESEGVYDVIVGADTLCYFGELEDVLRATSDALTSNGFAVFTFEALSAESCSGESPSEGTEGEKYRVSPNGRFKHSQEYIRAALSAANLRTVAFQTTTLRHENGIPVAAYVVTAERASDSCDGAHRG